MTQMLYKFPGPHAIHGAHYDYVIVDEADVDATVAEGWFLTTPEAKEAYEASRLAQKEPVVVEPGQPVQVAGVTNALGDPVTFTAPEAVETAPPTREELEQKAKELGIEFDGRTSDKKLGERIAEKLRA